MQTKNEFVTEIYYTYSVVFQGIPWDLVGTCRMFNAELGIHVLITTIIDSLAYLCLENMLASIKLSSEECELSM